MLYNELRPRTFDQVVGQRHIVENIRNQSKENLWFQVYILAGQFGGGKTTMARIIALASNCKNKDTRGNPCLQCENCKCILDDATMDIIEIDAASNRGIDNIRELKDSTVYKPFNLDKKIYIIDEVHMLSKEAFNALLKILEEPPKNIIFILCTTDLKAIPATIRSRAAIYIFEQIPLQDIFKKLKSVASERSINISHDALVLIAKNAQGSMRNAYSLLQQVALSKDDIVSAEDVQNILGLSDPGYIFDLLKDLLNADISKCVQRLEKAAAMGKDMSFLINDMIEIIANAVIAKASSINLIHETEYYKNLLSEIINMADLDHLCHIADGLMDIRMNLKKCPDKTTVSVGFIRIASNKSFVSRLERLEKIVLRAQEEKTCGRTYNELFVGDNPDKVDNINIGINTVVSGSVEDKNIDVAKDMTIKNNDFSFVNDFIPAAASSSSEGENDMTVLKRLMERLETIGDDLIFNSAMLGCNKTIIENKLILKSPLKPVFKILDAYIQAYKIENVEARFDPSVII